jgi:cysteinyl-tRNA synthetase
MRTIRNNTASATLTAVFAALLAAIAGCPSGTSALDDDDPNAITGDTGATDAGSGASVTPGPGNPGGFLYVLQPDAVGDEALSRAAFKWLVLEPSREGDAASEFSRAELDVVRNGSGCGSKTILAYLSIGEAEDYRDYWDTAWVSGDNQPPIAGVAPSWLGPSNPRWGGNYKVRYWEPGWQAVILGTADGAGKTPLDRIIDAGFDGVYLDIVDGFEFWSDPDEGYAEMSREEARRRMIECVVAIGDYAHKTRGVAKFLVFPQNAEAIIYNDEGELDELSEAYLAAIDGIGIEDLFYADTDKQDESEVQFRVTTLGEFRDRGKTVLVTDYVVSRSVTAAGSGARVANFYQRALDSGFVPYAAIAEGDLDEIVTLDAASWPVSQPPACAE